MSVHSSPVTVPAQGNRFKQVTSNFSFKTVKKKKKINAVRQLVVPCYEFTHESMVNLFPPYIRGRETQSSVRAELGVKVLHFLRKGIQRSWGNKPQ